MDAFQPMLHFSDHSSLQLQCSTHNLSHGILKSSFPLNLVVRHSTGRCDSDQTQAGPRYGSPRNHAHGHAFGLGAVQTLHVSGTGAGLGILDAVRGGGRRRRWRRWLLWLGGGEGTAKGGGSADRGGGARSCRAAADALTDQGARYDARCANVETHC